jgi:diguanylate cyclase (GGDEF)-like protein/PAS domain S-box-containing protein
MSASPSSLDVNFQALAESASVLTWVAGTDKRCIWFNQAWLAFTGRRLDQEIGDGWVSGIHPADLDRCLRIYDANFEARTTFSIEYRLLHHSGEYRWIVDNGAPLYDSAGTFIGFGGSCWDVTAHHDALRAVEDRKRLLRAIYDTANVAILVSDAHGTLIHANQSAARMFGRPLDKLIGSGYISLIHPRERQAAHASLLKMIASEIKVADFDRLYWRHDGTEFWGHLNATRMSDEEGNLLGMVAVISDVDERKKDLERLRIAATVFEASHDGIMVTNAENRIISINQAFTLITGYTAEEVLGKTPAILRSGEHPDEFYAELWKTLASRSRWDGEVRNRRKDGSIKSDWLSIALLRNDAGAIVNHVAIISDITEHKAAAARMRQMAQYDYLTSLPNRALFNDRMQHTLANAQRYQRKFALLFIDLDNFKPINDSHGHRVGDAVLCEIARRLSEHIRASDTVARLGGDEFVVLAPEIENLAEAGILADKVVRILASPLMIDGIEFGITVSIGVATFPADGESAEELISAADRAMYAAKNDGRNTWRMASQLNDRDAT